MGRKKKSNISSTGSRNGSISHIPYFGISYSFEDMKDFTDSEEIEHETPSISSEPSAGPESSSPRSLSPKHIPLSIIAPPITPLSSKRKNSVHFKHRKSTTIDLLLNSSSSLEPKQHSVSPISPEYLKSNSVSSHFSLKSPSLSKSSSISSRTSRTSIPPELECAEYMEVPKVSSNITKDWAKSKAMKLAMNCDEDDFTIDLKNLVTQVCEHDPLKPSEIFVHFPAALKLLLQLHRELRCPPHLHETFWVAHRTPSHANLATILSRIILLAESRVLLFDLLKACMGNPSPRLLTRMLEDSKRKQEEKVANADLFARLNYFGQSSDQIRARARATTAISAATSTASSLDAKSLPKDLDELRQLIRGTSQEGSILPEKSYLPRNSQILKPSQMIQLPGMTSDDTSQPFFKRFLSSKVPSMEMITEDFEEEEDEDEDIFDTPENNDMVDGDAEKPNHEVDERTRQESIRKFVQARFSGRDSGSNVSTISRTLTPSFTNPSNSFCFNDNDAHPTPSVSPPPEPVALSATPFSPSIAPKHRASKRVSMQCVHPKLLEKICLEWMASVPWFRSLFVMSEQLQHLRSIHKSHLSSNFMSLPQPETYSHKM